MSRATIVLAYASDRSMAHAWIDKAPVNTRLEFKAPRRTLPQNDKLWASLTDIAMQVPWHGLKLTPDLYLDYVMSEMNVAQALADGVPTEQIRNWCAKTLESVFQGEAHEVVFQGYIAYLDQINSLPG